MKIKVWARGRSQLLRGGEEIRTPTKIKLEDHESNVDNLREAVMVKFTNQLHAGLCCSAAQHVDSTREHRLGFIDGKLES